MASITEYMQRLQRILGDQAFQRFNPYDLVDYINEARGYVAAQGECIRVLCPSTAGLSSVQLTAGGTGYTTAPTVTISPPNVGQAATAVATVFGGAVTAVQVLTPGSGYSTPTLPGVSFSGGGGSGAAANPVLMPFCQTTVGQEVYTHASFNPLIKSTGTGASEIIAIRSIAVSWGSMKPTLRQMTWGDFQAYLRSYNVGVQGYSRVWAPYQRGTNGSFYIWPIPSQASQMDLDCVCLPAPLDLQSNQGLEPIPYPFTQAVPYKAAEVAVLGEPDLRDLADRYRQHYDLRMQFASATGASQSVIPDYYDPASGL
jgi:hypothetical protein